MQLENNEESETLVIIVGDAIVLFFDRTNEHVNKPLQLCRWVMYE